MNDRLTVYTENGPALALDGPYSSEQEAKAALMRQYRHAVAKLAEYEDIDPAPARLHSYKIHSKRVSALNSCNDCGKARTCVYIPRVGEYARINCPLWANGD